MSAANELLSAIHARLSGDSALAALIGPDAIRDRFTTGRHLPCIVIGNCVTSDYSTSTESGEEHLLALEIWSDDGGRKQVQAIGTRLQSLLQDAALELGSHHLVGLQHLTTRTRREPKTRLHVAETRFRAVTE